MSSIQHRVKVNVGYTRNMGNFESLRVDIGLEVEANGNPAETFERTYSFCEKALVKKVDEVEKEIRGVTGTKAE